MHKATQLNLPR